MCIYRLLQKAVGWTWSILLIIFIPGEDRQRRLFLLIEYYVVLLISLLVLFIVACLAYRIILGYWAPPDDGVYERLIKTLELIHKNWVASLIVIVPLFFRPLREFLETASEVGPLKKGQQSPLGKAEGTPATSTPLSTQQRP